jgi:hypothetical protein
MSSSAFAIDSQLQTGVRALLASRGQGVEVVERSCRAQAQAQTRNGNVIPDGHEKNKPSLRSRYIATTLVLLSY